MSDDQARDATFAAFMAQHYGLGPNDERVLAPLPYDNTPPRADVAHAAHAAGQARGRNVDACVRRHFPN